MTQLFLFVTVFLSFSPLTNIGVVIAKAGDSTFCTNTQLAKASTAS